MPMPEATLVAVLAKPPSPSGQEIVDLPPAVRWLQVRADRAGDLDPQWLRDRFSGELLYTLRSSTAGGAFESVNGNRPAPLIAAAPGSPPPPPPAPRSPPCPGSGSAGGAWRVPRPASTR